MRRQMGIDGSVPCLPITANWAVRLGMSRSSKIVGDVSDISLSLIGVRLWGCRSRHDHGRRHLTDLVEELDPNNWWTRITRKRKANDDSQKVHSLSDKQGITARSQCSCIIQAFCSLRDFQNGIESSR